MHHLKIIEEKQVHVDTTEIENEDGTYTYDTVLVETPKEETPAEPVVAAPESVTIESSEDDSFVEDTEEKVEGKKQIPGSNAFVPSTVGLIIAGEVIKDLIK